MILVHFYAGLRELAKRPTLELPWEPMLSVSSLRLQLSIQLPEIEGLLARSNVAVNDQLVAEDAIIPDAAEVALLPPVSGG